MNNTDAQIKAAYETNGMSPLEIAEDLNFTELAVKAKLMAISSKYRKDCNMEPEDENDLNFTNDQLRDFNKIIHETALSAEYPDGGIDYATRLRAATYGRDDKKGRKEIVKNVGNNTFNMISFNEASQAARLGAERIRKQIEEKKVSIAV